MKRPICTQLLMLGIIGTMLFQFTALSAKPATNSRSPFMLVLIPDTQYYSLRDPDTYKAQTEWIVDYRQFFNIKFAIHLGDITHNNTDIEWQAANAAHNILDNAGVPYSVIPGNHDNPNYGRIRDTSKYNKYFSR